MRQGRAKVYVVDDDVSVLRSLERLFEIAGYAVEVFTHPHELFEGTPERSAPGEAWAARTREGPACAVLDLRMPDLGGLELQEALTRMGRSMPVVFISGHDDIPAVVQAMKAGAVDFLSKPVHASELLAAVERAVARDAAERNAQAERDALRARLATLTPRERDVCRLLARGLLSKEIAVELGTAEQTVRVQRARVMEKLAVRSAVELALLVGQTGELLV